MTHSLLSSFGDCGDQEGDVPLLQTPMLQKPIIKHHKRHTYAINNGKTTKLTIKQEASIK